MAMANISKYTTENFKVRATTLLLHKVKAKKKQENST